MSSIQCHYFAINLFILIRVTDMALDPLINLLSKPYFPSNYQKNERDYHA